MALLPCPPNLTMPKLFMLLPIIEFGASAWNLIMNLVILNMDILKLGTDMGQLTYQSFLNVNRKVSYGILQVVREGKIEERMIM
jgi:hypothetical protein